MSLRIITIAIAATTALSAAVCASESLLPRTVIIPLGAVNRYVSDVTKELGTGANSTAVGRPTATRSVIYAASDGMKKVTLSVDRYASAADASAAFQEALEKSTVVAGFKPVSMPTVGQRSFAGTVSRGRETHVGLGALQRTFIVQATLAGYAATPENRTNLLHLARAQLAAAEATLGFGPPR